MAVRALRSVKSALAYEGWAMVGIGFVCIALGFGATTAAMPLMYNEVMTEFGWTRTQATLLFTYKNVASALVALFVIGPVCARFGLRTVMIGSLVLTGIGMMSFLWIGSLASYYLVGFLLGLGLSTILVSTNILISRWFSRRQGLATGIVLIGVNAGGVVFPVLTQWLMNAVGWRMTFALLSLGIWAVCLPLYALRARNSPTEQDTLEEMPATVPEPQPAAAPARLADLMRSGTFWTVAACIFMIAAVDSGVFQHTGLFLERDVGLSAEMTAYCFSAIFGIGILAKVAAGRLFDAWSVRGISFIYVLSALTLIAALSIQGALTLFLFVLLRGFSHGALVAETPVLAKHCYGPKLMDFTLPIFAGTWAVGGAVGPVILSVAHEQSGSYHTGFLAFIVISLTAAALLYRVRPHYRLSMLGDMGAGRQRVEGTAPSSG